jgi:general secretion pathway protein K
VVVVWGLGLVTLLGTMAIVGARYRSRDAGDTASLAGAAAAAESGVALGILHALMPGDAPARPFGCSLPDRSVVRVRVTREAGKVDLNAAPLALLARLFTALARDPARGLALAQAVVAYRDRPQPGAAPEADPDGPKHAPFLTTLELDQVRGLSPDLLAAALPHVTVVAGRDAPDPEAATPELLALLGTPRRPPAPGAAGAPAAPAGPVTVRAEAWSPEGAVAVREALVTFGTGTTPYAISEWRSGLPAPERGADRDGADARPCLR